VRLVAGTGCRTLSEDSGLPRNQPVRCAAISLARPLMRGWIVLHQLNEASGSNSHYLLQPSSILPYSMGKCQLFLLILAVTQKYPLLKCTNITGFQGKPCDNFAAQ
jgi:hypothetical protein